MVNLVNILVNTRVMEQPVCIIFTKTPRSGFVVLTTKKIQGLSKTFSARFKDFSKTFERSQQKNSKCISASFPHAYTSFVRQTTT